MSDASDHSSNDSSPHAIDGNASPPRARFPLVIALSLVAFLILFRLAIGADFGLRPSPHHPDLIPTGFVGDLRDNFSYASWAQQARAGAWLFYDVHTTDAHRAIYFNPYYLAVGRLARLFGIQPFFVMNVLGLLGAGVTVFVMYFIARTAGLAESAARWATVFLAFGMGLSVPAAAIYKMLGIDPMADTQRLGADIWYHDAFGFNCFMTLPYQSFGWALMSLVVLAVITCLRKAPCPRRLLLLAIATAALASVRPYEPVILLSSYGLFALAALAHPATRWRGILFMLRMLSDVLAALAHPASRTRWRLILLVGVVLGLAAAPFVLYQFWVSQQPVWRDFAALASISYRSRVSWLIGYGLFLPLAIYGAVLAWRDEKLFPARWFTAWLALLILLLIVLEVRQTKFSSAGTIPISLLAAHAWTTLIARVRKIPAPPLRRLALAGLVGVTISFFLTTPAFAYMLGKHFDVERSACSRAILDASLNAIELRPDPSRPPSILCDDDTGNRLVSVAPVRVYLGHSAMTPDFPTRFARVADAGFFSVKIESSDAFDTLVRDADVDYVLVAPDTAAFDYATKNPSLRLVDRFGRFGEVALFQLARRLRRETPLPPQAAG
ncbi:MAG: hypothetical protein ABIP55_10325 [Tepidisphaeraceae bacterium]